MNNAYKLQRITKRLFKKFLEPIGYIRRGNTFNRVVDSEYGVVHVINFQAARYDPDSDETKKIKEQLFGAAPVLGTFTLNFGVYVTFGDEVEDSTLRPDYIQEYSCQVRARPGGITKKHTIWLSVDADLETLVTEIVELISKTAIPFFDRFYSREAAMKIFEEDEELELFNVL